MRPTASCVRPCAFNGEFNLTSKVRPRHETTAHQGKAGFLLTMAVNTRPRSGCEEAKLDSALRPNWLLQVTRSNATVLLSDYVR